MPDDDPDAAWDHPNRPFPPPGDRPWVMFMRWLDLAFLHWPVDRRKLRPLIPPQLELETFEGTAWLGVVPFVMTATRPRLAPPVPGLSTFPGLNVRTYVSHGKGDARRPGIWFFSLDAASTLAVHGARATYHLPYYRARMRATRAPRGKDNDAIDYESTRRSTSLATGGATWLDARGPNRPAIDVRGDDGKDHNALRATFAARYGPTGRVYRADPGTLDYWLTERYCLYAADARGRVYRGDIHHPPWPLQRAEIEIARNTMTAPLGLALPDTAPLAHFARRQDVRAWWRVRVDGD